MRGGVRILKWSASRWYTLADSIPNMTSRRIRISDIVQYYRPLDFFESFGSAPDEAIVDFIENELVKASGSALPSDIEVLAFDTSRVFTSWDSRLLTDELAAADISKADLARLGNRKGVLTPVEWLDGRVSLIRLTQSEVITLRRERLLSIWNPIQCTPKLLESGILQQRFFRWAFYGRTAFSSPSFGRGLSDIPSLFAKIGLDAGFSNTIDRCAADLSKLGDSELAPIFAGALGTATGQSHFDLSEIVLCYSPEYRQSPVLVLEPLNYQVSRKVLQPMEVRTIGDLVSIGLSTSIAERGLCEAKMLVLGPPPKDELPYYVWMHGLLSSVVLSHVHSMISEALRLFEVTRQQGNHSLTRWPGFNWDSDAERCWIWSESYEFVVTLFEYAVSKHVNSELPALIQEHSGSVISQEVTTGLADFLTSSTLERITEKCPEIRLIANIEESNVHDHARQYFRDLIQYLLRLVSSDGSKVN